MGKLTKIAVRVLAMWMAAGALLVAYGQAMAESRQGASEVKEARTAQTDEDVRSFFNATKLPSGEFFAYFSTSKTESQRCSLQLQADSAAKTVTATTTSIEISNQWGYNPQGRDCKAHGVKFTFVCREMTNQKMRCYFDGHNGSGILWGWYNDQVHITWRPNSLGAMVPSTWYSSTSYINRRQSSANQFEQPQSYAEKFFFGFLPAGAYEVYASTLSDNQIRGLDCPLWFDASAYPKKIVAITLSLDDTVCSHEGLVFTFHCNLRTSEGLPKTCEYRQQPDSSPFLNVGALAGIGGGILKILWHQSPAAVSQDQAAASQKQSLVDDQRHGVTLLRPHASNTEMYAKNKAYGDQIVLPPADQRAEVKRARLEPIDPNRVRDDIVALFAKWPALSKDINNRREAAAIHFLKSMSLTVEDGCEAQFEVVHEEVRGGRAGSKITQTYTYTLNVGDLGDNAIAMSGDRVLISSKKPIKKYIVTAPYINSRGLRERLSPHERSTHRVELATSREKIRELRDQDLIGLFAKLSQVCRHRQG